MKRIHVVAVSLLLGLAALIGGIAATRTAHVGASTRSVAPVPSAAIAARNRRLDRVEASLQRALAQKPPAVPGAVPARAQKIVFVRPAPVVHVLHRRGDDGEGEREGSDD